MPNIFLRQVSNSDADLLADLRVRAMKESLEAVGRFDPLCVNINLSQLNLS